jgi:hypothetical protein
VGPYEWAANHPLRVQALSLCQRALPQRCITAPCKICNPCSLPKLQTTMFIAAALSPYNCSRCRRFSHVRGVIRRGSVHQHMPR